MAPILLGSAHMGGKIKLMIGKLMLKIRRLSAWKIILVSVLASEILSEAITASMDMALKGTVTSDYLITGAVAALLVSFVIVAILASALNHMREDDNRITRQEEIIAESREIYRQIFQQASDYILVLEPRPDSPPIITDGSESAFEKHGYTRDEMIGKPVSMLISEKYAGLIKDRIPLILTGNTVKFETEHVRKDRTVFNVELIIKMITVSGKPIIYSIERDITDRKELERRQIELMNGIEKALNLAQTEKNNAIEANKLKSEFIANISHELNTPLTSVIGYSHLAIDRDKEIAEILDTMIRLVGGPGAQAPSTGTLSELTELAVRAKQAAAESAKCDAVVSEQGHRLHALISDLIDLSALEAGRVKFEELAVSAYLLLDSLERVQGKFAAEKKLALKSNAGEFLSEDIVFLGDAKKIEKVLEHLVENAIKYSKKGEINVVCGRRDGHVVFSVKDQGVGINDEEKEKIFDTFRQLDGSSTRSQGGLGLGLSLVRKLVLAMNGNIDLKSEVGKGSEFIVSIPYRPVLPQ
jgi:PAS domain S-box-containing protein